MDYVYGKENVRSIEQIFCMNHIEDQKTFLQNETNNEITFLENKIGMDGHELKNIYCDTEVKRIDLEKVKKYIDDLFTMKQEDTYENDIINTCNAILTETNFFSDFNQISHSDFIYFLGWGPFLKPRTKDNKNDSMDIVRNIQSKIYDHLIINGKLNEPNNRIYTILQENLLKYIKYYTKLDFRIKTNELRSITYNGDLPHPIYNECMNVILYICNYIPEVINDTNYKAELIYVFHYIIMYPSSYLYRVRIPKKIMSIYKKAIFFNPNNYPLSLDEHMKLVYKLFTKPYDINKKIEIFKQLKLSPFYKDGFKYKDDAEKTREKNREKNGIILTYYEPQVYNKIILNEIRQKFEVDSELLSYYEEFISCYI